MSKILLLQGNQAVVEGAIAAGVKFFGGYPLPPSAEVAESLAERLPLVGGKFIQMEDEIASMGAIIGAALTGISLVSCTGGTATAASSGSGRVGLRCSFFGPASARSNVSSNSSLYKSQTLLSTIFGRSASSCQSLCGGKGNSFPHPAGAALCSLFPV